MGNACTRCRNSMTVKDDMLSNKHSHNCTCQDRGEKIKIDPGFKQTAAESDNGNMASGIGCRTKGGKTSDDLKSKLIQDIKDLPPDAAGRNQNPAFNFEP